MFKDNKYLIPIMLIVGVIIWILGGTLAYWNWQSSTGQKTEVTFTVGANFSCGANGGGNITNSTYFAPTTCDNSTYALKRTITTSITNNSSDPVYMDLWLNINSIGTGLSNSDNFMYALTTDENSCSNNVVASGNFKGLAKDDKVELLSGVTTASTYYLWIWLDAAETSQSTMNQSVNLSLGGSCTNNTENMTLYNKVASQADLTKTIDFSQVSSDTNGKGVYRFPGTENNTYPVYYYRGDIDNNHVKFANFCWRIVRTTDTGGVKLIYDGVPSNVYDQLPIDQSKYNYTNDSTYPFIYNAENESWTSSMKDDNSSATFTFNVKEAGDYIISYTISSEEDFDGVYFYKNNNELKFDSGKKNSTLLLNGLTTTDVISVKYAKDESGNDNDDIVIFTINEFGDLLGVECNNTGADTHISTTNIKFNENYNSPAYLGYMYGDVYTYSSATGTNWYYAPDVTYENGTYTLTSKGSYSVEKKSTISETNLNYQHYTCGSETATTCTSVRYVYYVDGSTVYYITLTNGKKVEDALSEMLTNSSNTTNSTIKTAIDTWYQNNMTSYTNKLEDTVYCNDRSIGALNGWNPDGGSTGTFLYFSGRNRAYATYAPNLGCTNKNDAFTVRESGIGNGKLTYPVGLLTSDEAMLAGMKGGTGGANYLSNGQVDFWLGSPSSFDSYHAYEFYVYSGYLINSFVTTPIGARSAVSLKPGMKISGGDGSSLTPYEIN